MKPPVTCSPGAAIKTRLRPVCPALQPGYIITGRDGWVCQCQGAWMCLQGVTRSRSLDTLNGAGRGQGGPGGNKYLGRKAAGRTGEEGGAEQGQEGAGLGEESRRELRGEAG